LFQDNRQSYFVILKQVQDDEKQVQDDGGNLGRDNDIVVGACIGFPT